MKTFHEIKRLPEFEKDLKKIISVPFTFSRFSVNDVRAAGRFFLVDKMLHPTAVVEGGVNQFLPVSFSSLDMVNFFPVHRYYLIPSNHARAKTFQSLPICPCLFAHDILSLMDRFDLVSEFKPKGDQPEAIGQLAEGVSAGHQFQTLLGVTGSGKTFTMANVIDRLNRPALVIAHNKTLAAQLCSEFREFFPKNAVEYFVSYYDYYQPEAYIPYSDTYIEKDSSINEEIDRLRHSATQSLLTRRDVIVVASVSCIYNLGSPAAYAGVSVKLTKGQQAPIQQVVRKLVDMQYERNDIELSRGRFRLRGDVLQIYPKDQDTIYHIEFFGDGIDRILYLHPVTRDTIREADEAAIFPATHFVSLEAETALKTIEEEMRERVKWFKDGGKLLEAQRIEQRTRFDMEMIQEIGYCNGIENYSRHFDGRSPGDPPCTLLSYFPEDFIMFIDESHATLPQVRGMYEGDKSRKGSLIDYGFRLPSAYDNRPLKFAEFETHMHQVIFVSATPGPYELKHSEKIEAGKSLIVEQIVRPTGLVDPELEIRPASTQVDDLIGQINTVAQSGGRILVTTLTKKMAENLSEYLADLGIRCRYLHSEIQTLERISILRDLRLGEYDVLVGVNLLREGLDLPEVSLVAILDADKEGFLRSQTSLIQTMGRAARNVEGDVILYADTTTGSMKRAIDECTRRRNIQLEYNRMHGITPESIKKNVRDILEDMNLEPQVKAAADEKAKYLVHLDREFKMSDSLEKYVAELERSMRKAADALEFEKAAVIRDHIKELKKDIGDAQPVSFPARRSGPVLQQHKSSRAKRKS